MIPRRSALAGLLCLVTLGCGESFKDEAEELEYLTSLSNPSPTQFRRRKELQEKAEAAREKASRDHDEHMRRAIESLYPEEVAKIKAEEAARKAEREAK